MLPFIALSDSAGRRDSAPAPGGENSVLAPHFFYVSEVKTARWPFLLNKFNYLFKHRRFIFGKVGEDFAVEAHFFGLERGDEAAVVHALLADGGVDLHVPEFSEHALLILPSLEGVRPGVEQGLLGGAFFRLPAPPESLRVFEQSLAFFMGINPSFDSRHGLGVRCQASGVKRELDT